MGSYTGNYSLYKPAIGERGWGTLVDLNFDYLDEALADFETRVTDLEASHGGHVIQEAGAPLTQRTALNFLYSELADDVGDDATLVGAPTGAWVPLTDGDLDDPQLIFAVGQVVMIFVEAL